jgi:polar amino acid transport system substrate-binding protein
MTSKGRILVIAVSFVLVFTAFIYAKDYKVAVYQLPTAESFASLIKAIGEATNNNFDIQIVPPARGVYLVENQQVDIIFPSTVSNDLKKQAGSKFDYSTVKAFKMIFVLYTNKNKPVDVAELKKGNPKNYKIETTASLAEMFEFTPLTTTNLEASLKKVDSGIIDGFLYAQEAGDPVLKNLGLKNISRKFYSKNDIAFGIQKGAKGTEIDKMLAEGIEKVKANGKFNQILTVSIKNSEYDDWQP